MIKGLKIIVISIISAGILMSCKSGTAPKSTLQEIASESSASPETESIQESIGEAKILPGVIEGGVYVSEMFGIKFDARVNNFSFDETVIANKDSSDTKAGDKENYIENGGALVDMSADSPDGSKKINISIEKGNNTKDMDEYVDRQIILTKERIKGSREVTKLEKESVQFLGKETPCISYEVSINNNIRYHETVFIKSGKYVAVIDSTADNKADAKRGMEVFTKIDEDINPDGTGEEGKTSGEKGFLRGEIEENIYTNRMFGIKFDISSKNIVFADEEEMEFIGNPKFDQSDTASLQSYIDGGNIYVDMYAHNEDYTNIIYVILDRAPKNNMEAYIDSLIPQYEESFSSQLTDIKVEKSRINFAGSEAPCINIEGNNSDNIKEYESHIYLKAGNYMAVIVGEGMDPELIKESLNLFSGMEN